jgi:D-alanyl-D-alanine carboxypeptidase
MRRGLVVLAMLTGCATTQPPALPPIPAPFDRAIWAIHVEDDDGRVVHSQNGHTLMIPASNRKLFASATIANCLGLDTRLETTFWLDGEDLIVKGDGDPSLGSWRYGRELDFDEIARLLESRGITRVRDVVADVSLFDRVTIPGTWKVGNLQSDYAAPVDAISWGENEVAVDRAVPDAALHAATSLRAALHARGIGATGVRVNTEPRAWRERIAMLQSPFVGDLLRTVLKNSHNLYTEMLLKRAGGGTYAGGFALERQFAAHEARVDPDEFRFMDGSGLSPDDLVTPAATVAILRWMNHPWRRAYWWSTLAQPNNEGTLRRRLVAFETRLRGKTGTVNGVNALAGIIAMPDGRFRYFAIVVNHHTGDGDEAVKVIDRMVERFAVVGSR